MSRKLGVPLVRVGFPIHDRIDGPRMLHVGYRGAQQLFDRIANVGDRSRPGRSPGGLTRTCDGEEPMPPDTLDASLLQLDARHRHGRVHLPVAPDCNVQCNFCKRIYDCANESRPGVTSGHPLAAASVGLLAAGAGQGPADLGRGHRRPGRSVRHARR